MVLRSWLEYDKMRDFVDQWSYKTKGKTKDLLTLIKALYLNKFFVEQSDLDYTWYNDVSVLEDI